MAPAQFRRIALSMPEAAESAHMGHPDFRVRGKIFATLFSRDKLTWGMVKLKPEQQRRFVKSNPEMFEPVLGGWGKGGATLVRLKSAKSGAVRSAMITAWRNTAPKQLVEEVGLSGED